MLLVLCAYCYIYVSYFLCTCLQVEWSNGPETMEEVLARIHLREEAAVKRERAMAYAFSHQVYSLIALQIHHFVLLKVLNFENILICSGEPIQTLLWVVMNLAKLSGVGVGWNAGLLLGHGKAEPLYNQVQRNQ